jgi:putative transposase
MSRPRRPFLYDRYIFVTANLLGSRATLQEGDYSRLAISLARMRQKHGFLLTAWVFLPDPAAAGHAIICPPYPLTISRVFQAVKVSSMISINHARGEAGELWQGRFFDRALRTGKEYIETVEYIHLNPVRRGLVKRAEDWKWSSVHEYSGMSAEEQERRCGLRIDRVRLPADENARI